MSETIWGIHAGRGGAAHDLFMRGVIAVGWSAMPDLTTLTPDREAFKAAMLQVSPDAKPGAIPVWAGLLFRFVHEMQIGDIVAYPSKVDREIYLGRLRGEYVYEPSESAYPHQRSVEWVTSFPRTRFSQGALYEIGSAVTLFQIKNYADEYLAALHGGAPPSVPVEEDETVALVAEEIETTTRDYVVKRLARDLKGYPLEEFVAELFEAIGYRTRTTQRSGDKGIDVIAHRDELGIEPPIIKVQVKSTEGTVGDPEVSQLYGKVATGEFGVMVTLGSYSKQARDFADSKGNLRLIDGDEVVRLVLEYYEKLDSKYKGWLSLKRVYIPEAIGDGAE